MTKLSDLKLDVVAKLIKDCPYPTSVTYTGWVFEGGKTKTSNSTICHAGLAHGPKDAIAVWSRMQDHTQEDKDEKLFVDYMLKESPWKNVFLNPNRDHVKKYGWIADADQDAHLVVNACVATRLISEFPSRFKFFIKAVENGMSKDTAMVLSQFCEDTKDKFYVAYISGHGFVYDKSKKIISNFVNHKPIVKEGRSYKLSPSYSRHCDVWDGTGSGYADGAHTYVAIKDIPEYKSVEKINLNIFYSSKKQAANYIYHSYDSAKWFEQKVKEKLVNV